MIHCKCGEEHRSAYGIYFREELQTVKSGKTNLYGISIFIEIIIYQKYDRENTLYVLLLANTSVHMPLIGCGLAGGTLDKIEPLIESSLTSIGISVTAHGF